MTSFLQPSVYSPNGGAAETNNLTVQAVSFVVGNQTDLQALLQLPGVQTAWHSMQVVSSASLSANRWTYTLKKVIPASSPTSVIDVTLTDLTAVTAYNLAEYGNTSSVAGGGVNATRANAVGFNLLPVPDGAYVHAFLIYDNNGASVALFERMNQWDGECPTILINLIDGGTY